MMGEIKARAAKLEKEQRAEAEAARVKAEKERAAAARQRAREAAREEEAAERRRQEEAAEEAAAARRAEALERNAGVDWSVTLRALPADEAAWQARGIRRTRDKARFQPLAAGRA